MTTCFVVHKTDRHRRSLRRFVMSEKATCAKGKGFHNASTFLDVVSEDQAVSRDISDPQVYAGRWPEVCEACGYEFTDRDEFQLFCDRIYVDDAGVEYSLRNLVPGMMWEPVGGHYRTGPDGKAMMVVCPDGSTWHVDGRASNCTMPNDKEHRCWVRHGTWPNITVDKNGLTCEAGAGSIQTGGYHGFLQNGRFT